MNRLTRTRSQHFVSSPRKVASPMKHKLGLTRHTSKRRRVGSSGLAALDVDGDDEEVENEDEGSSSRRMKGHSRDRQRQFEPLSSEAGLQRVNRGEVEHKRDKGKGKAVMLPGKRDVFDDSPRKRKRGDPPTPVPEEAMEQDDEEDTRGRGASGSIEGSIAGSGSWIEIDEDDQDEDEPEFIAESDQHLLADAPGYALRRLKKAELVRLWKVAGMWKADDDVASTSSTGDDDGLSKKDLVDGLIAARNPPSVRQISALPSPRNSPRARVPLGESSRSRSYSTLPSQLTMKSPSPSLSPAPPESRQLSTSTSHRSRARIGVDSTPKANPRTRSRIKPGRNADGTPHGSRTAGRAIKGRKNGRIARFGDDVKSPAHGLLAKRERQTSSLSSIYTTTDGSDTGEIQPPRTTRRTRKRGQSLSGREIPAESDEEVEEGTDVEQGEEEGEDSAMPEPAPLVTRLRSRTKSLVDIPPPPSEPDADDEEEDEDTGEDEDASPGPSRRTRSRDQLIDSTESSRSRGSTGVKSLPKRGAKARAMRRLRDADSDDEENMDVDEDAAVQSPAEMEQDDDEDGDPETDAASEQDEDADAASSPPRTIRRGQPFVELPSRRRQLKQEALDDPDMDVDEEDAEEEGEEDVMDDTSDEDSEVAFDVDLEDATIASLTRLLRAELVQLCESRDIEVGGTKPQLAKALLDWRDEQNTGNKSPSSSLSSSSQVTARPASPRPTISSSKSSSATSRHKTKDKLIHAIGSNTHVKGKRTPVLLRDHIHATDPATPQHSDEGKQEKDTELNFDLAELGLEDSIILPEHLTKLERIGSGGFKDVYVGKWKGRKVAISEFRSHLSEMDMRELKLLADFSHPNIVRFRGICIPEDSSQVQCMLVSELCENGDLFDYIRNVGTPTLRRLLGLMLDIARGLEYLHTRRPAIIHRDCKSSNILINRAGQAKVGDFGLARVKTSTRSMINSLVGTVNWQAPELWHPTPMYDYKVDVFSAGLVYWEMMSGWTGEKKYPWEGHNEHYIYDAVGQKCRRPSVAGLRKHWGPEPVNLMERMWLQDAGERPTMSDVVADLEAIIADL